MRRVRPPILWAPLLASNVRSCWTKFAYTPNPGSAGIVLATPLAISSVHAMDSANSGDNLIKGVPYCKNTEAEKLLDQHFVQRRETGGRYSLVCNTGATGVGKTTLQCQNMLQMARGGCMSVYIDFNSQQPSIDEEFDLNFAARVALRVRWYTELKKGDQISYHKFTEKEIASGAVEGLTIVAALKELKTMVGHTGPAFLAVDELLKSTKTTAEQRKEKLESHLNLLCMEMDSSQAYDKPNDRIFLGVSVYDIVSLGDLETASKRKLLHQPTPPIFPLWMSSGTLQPTIAQLPPALRIFFDSTARRSFYDEATNKLRASKIVASLGELVFASAGHGRRVEALTRSLGEFAPAKESTAELLKTCPVDLEAWRKGLHTEMNLELDLKAIGRQLVSACAAQPDPPLFLKHLLEGLFHGVVFDDDGKVGVLEVIRGTNMRLATLYHYGLLRSEHHMIGYLPAQALAPLCAAYRKQNWQTPATAQLESLMTFVNLAVTECLKFPMRVHARAGIGRPHTEEPPWKVFERLMMFSMCASLISGADVNTTIASMVSRGNPSDMELSENLVDIEVLGNSKKQLNVREFPCAFSAGKTTAIPSALLQKILSIGNKENDAKGLAFLPSNEYNLCCDFVVVLPKRDGGRLVLLVQCKHWFGETSNGSYAFDEFRWGQQFVEEKDVFTRKDGEAKRINNRAWSGIQKLRDHDTTFHYVLLTVNSAPLESDGETMKNTLSTNLWRMPPTKRNGELRDDEWLMDLEHMRKWCPTVAYSTLMGLQVQNLWAPEEENVVPTTSATVLPGQTKTGTLMKRTGKSSKKAKPLTARSTAKRS